jgi:hypothetical protein
MLATSSHPLIVFTLRLIFQGISTTDSQSGQFDMAAKCAFIFGILSRRGQRESAEFGLLSTRILQPPGAFSPVGALRHHWKPLVDG